jgi:hypothetical protein
MTLIAALFAHFGAGFAGFLALFAVGTVVYRLIIGKNECNDINIYIGSVVLVAGAGSEVLGNQGRWPANTIVFCFRIAPGGVLGFLSADFTPATGTVAIASSNAGDTSTCGYMVLAPIG